MRQNLPYPGEEIQEVATSVVLNTLHLRVIMQGCYCSRMYGAWCMGATYSQQQSVHVLQQ